MPIKDCSFVSKTRILVVDDHPIIRDGIQHLIERQSDMVCCGQAETAVEARQRASELQPDLAIVDLKLREGDGLDLVRSFHAECPGMKIIVFSQREEQAIIEKALRAGALGYVCKEQEPADLLQAIRLVLSGQIYLNQGAAAQLIGSALKKADTAPTGADQLTARELDILRLLGEERSTRDIASLLGISFKTVESHRENIKAKLGFDTSAALLDFARGWIKQPTSIPGRPFPSHD